MGPRWRRGGAAVVAVEGGARAERPRALEECVPEEVAVVGRDGCIKVEGGWLLMVATAEGEGRGRRERRGRAKEGAPSPVPSSA